MCAAPDKALGATGAASAARLGHASAKSSPHRKGSMMNPDAPAIANIEAECALLGAMMIENRLIDRVADIVRAEDFAEPFMGRLFTLAMREHNLGKLANPVTLKPYIDQDPALAELGGSGFLAQLTGSGAALVGAVDMAEQIADLAKRRRLSERLL